MSISIIKNVRSEQQPEHTLKQTMLQICTMFIFGILLGSIAKYSDTISANGTTGIFFDFISNITTRLGIWVLLATIIAAWSRSPKMAAMKVFAFFAGLLSAYYLYSYVLFGFFPAYYFVRWGAIAIISPLAAYMVWFSRGIGWVAAIYAGLPIGLLLAQGYPFFYLFSAVVGFEILAALLLIVVLPIQKEQCLKAAAMGILIAVVLRNTNILPYLFGGL